VLWSDLPAALLPPAVTGTLHVVTGFARSLRAAPPTIGPHVADLLLCGFAIRPE
jgi:hypothetical protein